MLKLQDVVHAWKVLRSDGVISVITFAATLFFANISYLENEVLRTVKARDDLSVVHFKCNGNNEVDAGGERSLGLLVSRLHAAGYALIFSGLKLQVMMC